MSCNEWTHGKIKLPSAEVGKVWNALVAAVTADSQKKYDAAQEFWKGLTRKEQTDREAYLAAIRKRDDYGSDLPTPWHNEKPRRAKKTDYQWPTKTTKHLYGDNLTISLDRKTRTLTYSVDGNHARDYADQSVLGQAWIKAMREVKWTHGTGGVLLGNDEYNEEAGQSYMGGGGSYAVAAYGYLGAKEAPANVTEFQTPKGWVHVETKATRSGLFKGEVKPGRAPSTYRPTYASTRYW